MFHTIEITRPGPPDVLQARTLPEAPPGPGEVLLRQHAIGVNYVDTYFRDGTRPLPHYPAGVGMEAAGTVEAVGPDVTGLAVGDRVAYAHVRGAYADRRIVRAADLLALPDGISFETAAAATLRGLTVQALLRQVYPVRAGQTILLHAAAGGVGQLLAQWASHLGVRVIGIVSSEEKAAIARRAGVAETLVGYHDLPARVRALNGGQGVPVVYDSVGRDTFEASLDCLAPRGLLVSFGNASGEVTGVSFSTLASKGSLYATRPTLGTFIADRAALVDAADELFGLLRRGILRVEIGQTFALHDAAAAHAAIESRRTTGSTILIP